MAVHSAGRSRLLRHAIRFVLSRDVTRFQESFDLQGGSDVDARTRTRMSLCSEKREVALSRAAKATSATFLRNNGRVLSKRCGARCAARHTANIFIMVCQILRVATIHRSNLLVRPCTAPRRTDGELYKKLQLDSLNRHDRLIKASAIFFVRYAEIKISLN